MVKSVRDILPNGWTVQKYGRDDPHVSITEIFPSMPPFRHEYDANRIGTSQSSSLDVANKTGVRHALGYSSSASLAK